jgi:small nuclear ribonucleoprotein
MVMPLDLLEAQLNQRIHILLKDGRSFEGKLVGYDQYMNIVLEEADEKGPEPGKRTSTLVLRGNNIVSMSQP